MKLKSELVDLFTFFIYLFTACAGKRMYENEWWHKHIFTLSSSLHLFRSPLLLPPSFLVAFAAPV